MSELIEIAFENLANESFDLILKEFFDFGKNLKNYNFFSPEEEVISGTDYSDFKKKLKEHNNFYFIANLEVLETEYFTIYNPSIVFMKNDSHHYLTLLFKIKDIIFNVLNHTEALLGFSKNLAATLNAKTYYGGIEPAKDLDTRIFTKNKIGPITI